MVVHNLEFGHQAGEIGLGLPPIVCQPTVRLASVLDLVSETPAAHQVGGNFSLRVSRMRAAFLPILISRIAQVGGPS